MNRSERQRVRLSEITSWSKCEQIQSEKNAKEGFNGTEREEKIELEGFKQARELERDEDSMGWR